MVEVLTEIDIEKLADKHKYTTRNWEGIYRDHFMFGGYIVNNHYKKQFDEIQKMVYDEKNKLHWVEVHLLKNFSTEQLIMIRNFLIDRTPKEENEQNK